MNAKRKILLGIGVICLFIFIDMCSHKSDVKTFDEIRKEDSIAAIKEDTTLLTYENKPVIQKWEYSEDANVMTDSKDYYASIKANDLLYFDSPYEGGVSASIVLRHRDGKNDIMLQISKGQFLSNSLGNKTIRVRFDKQKPERYSYVEPSDGSTEVIFIRNASKFLSKLKQTNRTIIECEFYDEGIRTMTFNTDSLKWKY